MTMNSTERGRKLRERRRHAGMRLIQMWVPDLRDPKVRAEIRRACEAVNAQERADPSIDAFTDAANADLEADLQRLEGDKP